MGNENKAGGGADDDFEAFVAAGEVEIGESHVAAQDDGEGDEPKPKPKEKAPAPAPKGDDGEGGEPADDADDADDAGEGEPKHKRTPSDRIRELNKRLRQSERLRLADQDRMAAIEEQLKKGLPAGGGDGNSTDEIGDEPDPTDTDKYPLGHLDDRYIEDKLDWLATKKAAERADAVLQRQQETDRQKSFQQEQTQLLEKVDDLATRGSEIAEDFQEAVVETGMRGDWNLTQTTFEAAYEAEHGAQILYDLSQDKKEAGRVASLTPYQQLKFVQDRNAEITAKAKPRTKPQAGEPPETKPRGASSKIQIRPDTDNLDDFEKAWEADRKKSERR